MKVPLAVARRKVLLLQGRHPDCHCIAASLQSRPRAPAIKLMLEHPEFGDAVFRAGVGFRFPCPQFAKWLETCCRKVGGSVRIRVERSNN